MELRKEILKSLPKNSKFYRNTKWVQTSCPKCDGKNKKMHLHIHLEEGKPIIYKCFRAGCNTAGLMNRYIGRKLNFTSKLNDKLEAEAVKFSTYSTAHNYIQKNKDYTLGTLDDFAVDYFNDRTGKDLYEFQDLLRISSNMTRFAKDNDIERKKVSMLLRMERNGRRFIYFFNDTFSTVFYREVYGENRKGRLNIISTSRSDMILSHKPYIIQPKGSLNLSEYFSTVILAEGPFDIINSYFHVAPKNLNATFISTGGVAQLRSVIFEYTKYHYKAKIFIVSDNDVTISWYRHYLLTRIENRISELIILYNLSAHDVGDINAGINMNKVVLKDLDPLLLEEMRQEERGE